jgi:Prenyltransferase and squalene oxidase repeat
MLNGVPESLYAGLEFLLRRQSRAGCWSDWDLPPGPSDSWTTAYIGCQLTELPRPFRARSLPARRAAAQWLVQHRSEGGGWGYNANVGADADSTAHALQFLSSDPVIGPGASCDCLIAYQQLDGGFSTYPSDAGLGSWGTSHADVTAVAARALLSNQGPGSAALARAREYLLRRRKADGTWDSFWWASPLYATTTALSLLHATELHLDLPSTQQTLVSMAVENAFERALLIEALTRICTDRGCHRLATLVQQLVSKQLPDGSWASAPTLRLTNRQCANPAASPFAGPLFADPERLFTSATVLRALSRVAADDPPRARTGPARPR